MRLRVQRRNHEARRMNLMNAARMLQHRGSTSKSRLSLMMEQKYRQELTKSQEFEKVRESLEEHHFVCASPILSKGPMRF